MGSSALKGFHSNQAGVHNLFYWFNPTALSDMIDKFMLLLLLWWEETRECKPTEMLAEQVKLYKVSIKTLARDPGAVYLQYCASTSTATIIYSNSLSLPAYAG